MKIAIASGKGGTGKTTLSSNFAAFISEKTPTILVDLDVEEPNSGLFIQGNLQKEEIKYKMIPEWQESVCTMCGKCQKNCNFHAVISLGTQILIFPELCHSCYACSELCPEQALPMKKQKMGVLRHYKNKYLDFIESKLDIGQEQAVPLIGQTIEYIQKNFNSDFIWIYDSPPGTSCPVIEVTKNADYIILVTEPTPFGLYDLNLAVDTMKQLNKPFGVVINKSGIGNNDVMNYCNENKIPILAKIPNSREIATLYSNGELIYKKIPEFNEQLRKIYDYLQNDIKN